MQHAEWTRWPLAKVAGVALQSGAPKVALQGPFWQPRRTSAPSFGTLLHCFYGFWPTAVLASTVDSVGGHCATDRLLSPLSPVWHFFFLTSKKFRTARGSYFSLQPSRILLSFAAAPRMGGFGHFPLQLPPLFPLSSRRCEVRLHSTYSTCCTYCTSLLHPTFTAGQHWPQFL